MPQTADERRFHHAIRLIGELRAWRNAREDAVSEWLFIDENDHEVKMTIGDFWPKVVLPAHFRGHAHVPQQWIGEQVELELWLGGEGLVRLSTGLQAGLTAMHHRFPVIESATGGETISIEAYVSPKGMFGSHVAQPAIEHAMLVVPNDAVRALERDLTTLTDAYRELHAANAEVAPFLLDIVDRANACWCRNWPTAIDVALTRYIELWDKPLGNGILSVPLSLRSEALDVAAPAQGLWSLPEQLRPLEPLPKTALEGVREARALIADGLTRLKERYPPIGSLALTGHAHIDLAWLWPMAETRRKNVRTFSTVLNLMDGYDDFVFNQSSAQAYVWLEQDDPVLLQRIADRVKEKRWEPVGGSWVEPDCQVTGGESFVRQLFYGQRTFERLFGRRHQVAWLPDVFGLSGAIPQLLRGAGIDGFFTIKLNWNEATPFPYDLFTWEGIDGSQVTAHMFLNPGHGYNGNIVPYDTLGTWRNFKGKRAHPESLLAFGWGDGGGGPTEKMLENYARLRDFPGLPRLHMGSVERFYAALPTSSLPKWIGELYLEYHRGTLTTQAAVKQLNRQAEHRLVEAELFGAIAAIDGFTYPHDVLEAAWKTLLVNQFHDILPGSSIHEVYLDTVPMLQEVVETALMSRTAALRYLAGDGESENFLVANGTLVSRALHCELTDPTIAAVKRLDTGEILPTQQTAEGALVVAPGGSVAPMSWFGLTRTLASPPVVTNPVIVQQTENGATLENEYLRVEIGHDGTIIRLFDKEHNREVLTDRGNQIWAYADKPRTYDAWDIEESYEQTGQEILAASDIVVQETGPLRGSVQIKRVWRDSTIVQSYRLLMGSRRLDIVTDLDWQERATLIKTHFPLAVRTHEAVYETMYGVVHRPTHRNTPFDAARFEVCGHRFADLSEPGYGVTLLNNAKYGYSAHDNVLSLSLIRGPLYPDPLADVGRHHFAYSLYPHTGDWTTGGVVAEAVCFNSPLIITTEVVPKAGSSFVTCAGLPIMLGALKPAENKQGVILRIYEPHGARGCASLTFSHSVVSIKAVNLLEDDLSDEDADFELNGDTLRLPLRPFQVRTLRIEFATETVSPVSHA